MPTGNNIADRHARLQGLADHRQLLICREASLRATPVITSTFENVSDTSIYLGLSLGNPTNAGVRSKRGHFSDLETFFWLGQGALPYQILTGRGYVCPCRSGN
jgi:hypothetical protein